MISSTTKTDEREQWRARILRALSELQTDAPGVDRGRPREDVKTDRSTAGTEV